MKFVLDACVAIKWFLAEPDSAKAIQVLDDFNRQIHELPAPDVFPIEVAHALSRAERRGLIQPLADSQHLSDLLVFLPALSMSLTRLPKAYEISSQAYIGVYDCLCVAPAERERCALLTADDRLDRALGQTFPFITLLNTI